ncbi:MAG: triphosphoribosyl-dephospho-CoA synthase [Zestosphaera sp.]
MCEASAFEVLVDVFSTSILIEALAPSKLSTVSGYKGVKDLNIIHFIYTPHVIRRPLERIVSDSLEGRGFTLGRHLREYALQALKHLLIGTNTAFGYLMLAIPLAYILGKASTLGDNLKSARTVVDKYSPYVVEGLKKEGSGDFYSALKIASMKHIGSYFGSIPSVTEEDEELLNKTSLWDVLRDSMYIDLVSHEIVTGFRRVLEAYEYLSLREGLEDLLVRVTSVHTKLLGEYIDTLVLKSRGLNAALTLKHLSNLRRVVSDEAWAVIDTYVREQRLNPGSVSDIVAAGVALYQVRRLC